MSAEKPRTNKEKGGSPERKREQEARAQGEAMQYLIDRLENTPADSDKKKSVTKEQTQKPSQNANEKGPAQTQEQSQNTPQEDARERRIREARAEIDAINHGVQNPNPNEFKEPMANKDVRVAELEDEIRALERERDGVSKSVESPEAKLIHDLEQARKGLIERAGRAQSESEKQTTRAAIAALEAQIAALGGTMEDEPQEGQGRHKAAGAVAAAGEIGDREADDLAQEAATAAETYVQPQEDIGPREMVKGDLYAGTEPTQSEEGPREMVEGDIFPEKVAADVDARARDEAEKAGTKEETEKARGAWGRMKDKMQDLILAPMVAIDNERYRRWPHWLRGALVGGAVVGVVSALLCGKDGGWLQEWYNGHFGVGEIPPEGGVSGPEAEIPSPPEGDASGPETAEPAPYDPIEGPLHIHEVAPGDTIWDIIENDPRVESMLDGLGEEQRAYVIDGIKDQLANMSSSELQALGIESGDVDKIFQGDQVDLNELLNDADLLDRLREQAENLTPEQIESIRQVIAQNEFDAGYNTN